MDSNAVENLKSELENLKKEALTHFESLGTMAREEHGHLIVDGKAVPVWNLLTSAQRDEAHALRSKVAALALLLILIIRSQPVIWL